MSLGLRTRVRQRPELPLVPLIDVLVMLVFFTFATMQFRSASILRLTLPKIETAGSSQFNTPAIIAVGRDGTAVLNNQTVTDEQLDAGVAEIAARSRDVTVLIKVDQDTPVKRLTFAMDTCRKHGLNKITLESR